MGYMDSDECHFECECSRPQFSRCQKCAYYISDSKCWYFDFIDVYKWSNFIDPEESRCNHYKSTIPKLLSNHYVYRDYDDKKLFPEKKFGGKFKFDKKGNIVGER